MLLRNQLNAGIVDVPEYGVRNKRGDFDPLVSEDLFFRAQAVLSGRPPIAAPKLRRHPDFPVSKFVQCYSCGRGLTGSWSKGRSDYYAYYHCRPGCRGVSMTKAKLEGLFADKLSRLQPTPGYMRLLKESVLEIWKVRKAAIRADVAAAERSAHAIQQKLDRLNEAFLFERSIEIETYDRHAEHLREEPTLARIAKHSTELDARRRRHLGDRRTDPAPRMGPLGASPARQRQRFQQLFFPEGLAFDGERLVGTAATAPAFGHLREFRPAMKGWWPRFSPDGTGWPIGCGKQSAIRRQCERGGLSSARTSF